MSVSESEDQPAGPSSTRGRRWARRLGPYLVSLAVLSAVVTLLVLADFTPISPSNAIVLALFSANAFLILCLVILLIYEVWNLISDLRARAAGRAATSALAPHPPGPQRATRPCALSPVQEL